MKEGTAVASDEDEGQRDKFMGSVQDTVASNTANMDTCNHYMYMYTNKTSEQPLNNTFSPTEVQSLMTDKFAFWADN